MAYTVTMVGDRFAEIVLPIAVLATTADPAAAGAVAASMQVPGLVFALGLGQQVDHGSRRTMLVVADLVRAVGFAAYALLELGDAATTIVGPAAAGAAIARTGAAWGLVVNAASFLISGTALRLLLPPLRPGQARSLSNRRDTTVLNRLVEPVRLLVGQRLQLTIQFALMALSAHGAGLVLAVVVLGRDELGLAVGQIGVVLSAAGVGGLVAGLVMVRTSLFADRVRTVALTLMFAAGAAVALAVSPSFWTAVSANLVLDAFVTACFVATATIRQARTPNQVLGRVSAAATVANALARVIGAAGVGLLLAAFGARTALAVDAVVLGVAGLLVLVRDGRSVPVRPAGERTPGPAERDQPDADHQRQDSDTGEEAGSH